jgi:hypothetical protein
MLCGMAKASSDLALEAYAQTQSKVVAPMEVSHGASSNLDLSFKGPIVMYYCYYHLPYKT